MRNRNLSRLLAAASVVGATLVAAAPAEAAPIAPTAGDIAFVSAAGGDSEIYLVRPDGSGLVNLTNDPANDGSPVWSPDGRDLAFVSDRTGNWMLHVLSSGIAIAPAENLDWSWSPDGRAIAWVSHGGVKDLWVTDIATGESKNLTMGAVEAAGPRWLPDARRIVFVGSGHVVVVSSTGGPITDLGAGHGPVPSPDGTRVAFWYDTADGMQTLATIALDGSDLRTRVTPGGARRLRSVAWSPDGATLAYSVTSGSPVTGLVEFFDVAAAGSTSPHLLATGGAWRSSGPFWAPTSDRVAVTEGGWSSWNVLLAGPGGPAGPVSLTALSPSLLCTADPSWSPDGARVVFEGYEEGCTQPAMPPFPPAGIYVVNRDGTGLVHLAEGADPVWRPAAYAVGLVDPATGIWHLNGIAPFYYGNPGDVPFLGDWNGDGVATPGLYRQSDGFVYLRNSNTQGVADIRFFFGNPGDIPLAGDFNGDGFDTVSIYRPSAGQVFVINALGTNDGGLGAAEYSFYFGNPGDQPFAGDFDGDGIDTVGLHRASTGFVYLRNSNTPGIADVSFYYGNPGDRLLAGDWTEDGTDTVGVFRPAKAMFYLRFGNTQGVADASFVAGRSGWVPVG